MEVRKTIVLDKDEITRILTKFIEKKTKSTVASVQANTDDGLEFNLTPTVFDEAGE